MCCNLIFLLHSTPEKRGWNLRKQRMAENKLLGFFIISTYDLPVHFFEATPYYVIDDSIKLPYVCLCQCGFGCGASDAINIFSFLRWDVLLSRSSPITQVWLDSEPQRSTCLHHPSAGIIGMYHQELSLFIWALFVAVVLRFTLVFN